jgi:hypothetical protein
MLRWVFGADTGPYRSALNQMRNETKSFAGSVKGMIGGMIGFGAIIAGFRSMFQEMDRVQKLAIRFNETAESIQRLGHAAKLNGTSLETMATAMTLATRNAAEAARGGKEMSDAYNRLGIDAASFANLPLEEKVLIFAKSLEDGGQSAGTMADMIKVLGRSGAEMIPLLAQGVEKLNETFADTATVSQATVDAIANFNDSITRLKQNLMAIASPVVFVFNIFFQLFKELGIYIGHFTGIARASFNEIADYAMISGRIIKAALKGNFIEAGKEVENYAKATQKRLEDMAKNAATTAGLIQENIKEIWGSGNKRNATPDVDSAIEDAERINKIEEERAKIIADIAKLEEDARQKTLSLTEKILEAEKKRAELAGIVANDSESDEGLTAKKEQLEIEKKLAELNAQKAKSEADQKSNRDKLTKFNEERKLAEMSDSDRMEALKKRQKELNKQTKEALGRGDEKTAVELNIESHGITDKIKAIQSEIDAAMQGEADAERDNKFAAASDAEKRAMLVEERDAAEERARELESSGNLAGAAEARTKALGITGDIESMDSKDGGDNDAKRALDELNARGPTIATSSLADIGGGGGARLMETNFEQKKVSLLEMIAANTAGGSEGSSPPEPI